MASGQTSFSRITVTDDEGDDEVVIHTSPRSFDSVADDEADEAALDDERYAEYDEPDDAVEFDDAEELDEAAAPEEDRTDSAAASAGEVPMSLMQKVIVVCAVVFVVGFCIYYAFAY